MNRTTLTRNLKPLIGKGLVSLENERDRTVRRVNLPAKGNRAFENALPHWVAVQSKLVAGLGCKRWFGFLDDFAATVDEARSSKSSIGSEARGETKVPANRPSNRRLPCQTVSRQKPSTTFASTIG